MELGFVGHSFPHCLPVETFKFPCYFLCMQGTKLKMYAIRAKDREGDRIMPFFNIVAAYVKQCLDGGGR